MNTGGRYKAGTDTWTGTSTTNAPAGRQFATSVWTGNEMIIWGGYFYDGSDHYLNTGGKYNRDTDSWIATSTTNTPSGRYLQTSVLTGSQMIVWGGYNGRNRENTGGRYNFGVDSWTATSTTNAPSGRYGHTAVWTGSEMIVWGGTDTSGDSNAGGRYCAQSQALIGQSAVSRKIHDVTGAFDIPLPLTGTTGVECRTTGDTNDYTIVVTFADNAILTGNLEAQTDDGNRLRRKRRHMHR